MKKNLRKLEVTGPIQISSKNIENISLWLNWLLVLGSLITFSFWFFGKGLFYSETAPVMSPFTSFSLLLMSTSLLAERTLETWSKPMTLAILGIVACGNLSSILMLSIVPELLFETMPSIPATSIMTSIGLVIFCFYEILVVIRRTPQSAFILDDILLHLALFPGGLSMLGHALEIPGYMSSHYDPRAGIGKMEMLFMGCYALVATICNPHLFLWKFLAGSLLNRVIFSLLFVNQYVAPLIVGFAFHSSGDGINKPGVELFVMIAGVLATLLFLIGNAYSSRDHRAEATHTH